MPIKSIKQRAKTEEPANHKSPKKSQKAVWKDQLKIGSLPLLLNSIKTYLKQKRKIEALNLAKMRKFNTVQIKNYCPYSKLNCPTLENKKRSKSYTEQERKPFSLEKWKANYSDKIDKFIMKRNQSLIDSEPQQEFKVVINGSQKHYIQKIQKKRISSRKSQIISERLSTNDQLLEENQRNENNGKKLSILTPGETFKELFQKRRNSKIYGLNKLKANTHKHAKRKEFQSPKEGLYITNLAPWKLENGVNADEDQSLPFHASTQAIQYNF